MDEKKVFFKVKSALMMKDEYVIERHKNASFTPSAKFNDMIIESDEKFRSAVLTFIDDVLTDEWAVRFTPFTDEKFDVRIFCNSDDDFKAIKKVILERLPNENFHSFIKEGSVSDIGNLW